MNKKSCIVLAMLLVLFFVCSPISAYAGSGNIAKMTPTRVRELPYQGGSISNTLHPKSGQLIDKDNVSFSIILSG